jgi:hypothetical protein
MVPAPSTAADRIFSEADGIIRHVTLSSLPLFNLEAPMTRPLTSLLAACCLAVTSAAAGQTRATTADLSGTVVDQSSAVLPGATVTAQNVDTNHVRSAITDERGQFMIPALPPGRYDVRAELQGFLPRTLDRVVLALGSLIDVRLTLNVAGGQETVDVSGDAPVIDTQRTAVSSVIAQDQIDRLPINGRNFIGFSLLTPGVASDRTPQQGASGTSGLSFAGQRARSNNITVDGLDNNDSIIGAVRATFSQEAVREFQVLTNSFSAEFGKASGGVVNIVTRSGTNTMAGNLFFFFRDSALNSKDHFERFDPAGQPIDREKAPYSQKQYGGTLGGPIRRDRTFYFLSYERLDIAAHNFVTIDGTNNVTFLGQNYGTPAQILGRAGFPVETGHVPYAIRSNQVLGKIDHQLSPNQSLTARVNWASDLNENIEPFGGNVARSRGAVLESNDLMFALSHLWVASAKMVNETRLQVAYRDQTVNSLDPKCPDSVCTLEDQGGPTLEVLGVASVGRQRFTPQPRENVRYQVLDTVSYVTGAHQFKGGFDFNYINAMKQNLPLHFGGRYIFGSIPAALAPQLGLPAVEVPAIVAVQLGIPARYVQGYGDSAVPYSYSDFSRVCPGRLANHSPRLPRSSAAIVRRRQWPAYHLQRLRLSGGVRRSRAMETTSRRGLGLVWIQLGGSVRRRVKAAYGLYFDNLIIPVSPASPKGSTDCAWRRQDARGRRCRRRCTAWNGSRPRVAGAQRPVSEPRLFDRSGLGNAVCASRLRRGRPRAAGETSRSRPIHLRARLQATVDARLQPARAVARPEQASSDVNGVPGLSVGAAVHVVRRDVVSRRHRVPRRGASPIGISS